MLFLLLLMEGRQTSMHLTGGRSRSKRDSRSSAANSSPACGAVSKSSQASQHTEPHCPCECRPLAMPCCAVPCRAVLAVYNFACSPPPPLVLCWVAKATGWCHGISGVR